MSCDGIKEFRQSLANLFFSLVMMLLPQSRRNMYEICGQELLFMLMTVIDKSFSHSPNYTMKYFNEEPTTSEFQSKYFNGIFRTEWDKMNPKWMRKLTKYSQKCHETFLNLQKKGYEI